MTVPLTAEAWSSVNGKFGNAEPVIRQAVTNFVPPGILSARPGIYP